jgi:hypothetical protein
VIEQALLGGDAATHEDEFDTTQADEQAAIAAAMPDGSDCVGGRARQGDVPPSPSPAAPAGAASSAPQRPETDIEKMARVNSTPANPPDNRNEPWRSHVNADGIIAPYFRGGG